VRMSLALAVELIGLFALTGPLWAEDAEADSSAGVGDIDVIVENVRTRDEGVLIISLYRGEKGWLELESAVALAILPVTNDTLVSTFMSVPHDTSYAIQVIHDKNQNGKFDMRWFPYPKPKEGAGVSNNNLRRGPPEYDKARFVLNEPTKMLTIRLQY
jgi:uncharacterized protein (DUF2141 family)